MRPCCPSCDSLEVVKPKTLDRWRCRMCGWKGQPNYREPLAQRGKGKPKPQQPETRGEVAGRKVIRGYVF